jgi:hypothetical protein
MADTTAFRRRVWEKLDGDPNPGALGAVLAACQVFAEMAGDLRNTPDTGQRAQVFSPDPEEEARLRAETLSAARAVFEGRKVGSVSVVVGNLLAIYEADTAPATPDTGQRERTGTEWGLRQASGWVAHMRDRPDAEETQKLHPDAVLVCRYVGQWSELEPSAAGISIRPTTPAASGHVHRPGRPCQACEAEVTSLEQAPAASNPELEALRAKLRQAPAASEQCTCAKGYAVCDSCRSRYYPAPAASEVIHTADCGSTWPGEDRCDCGAGPLRTPAAGEQPYHDPWCKTPDTCNCREIYPSRPAASEDTIEQAAEVGARALADAACYDYDTLPIDHTNHLRRTARTVLNAARGLLADGTDRRRVDPDALWAAVRSVITTEAIVDAIQSTDPDMAVRKLVSNAVIAANRSQAGLSSLAALTDTEDPAALTGGQP